MISDTTVMEKNSTFPTDEKLYDTARKHLVKLAKLWGIKLRQNYNFVSKRHLRKVGQYGHARQYKRMKKEVKKLKTFLERIVKESLSNKAKNCVAQTFLKGRLTM